MADYESEYNNRARVPEHPAIIAGWAADAAAWRAEGSNELSVRYGPSERQRYDLFRPQEMKGDALAVFLHGGYWQALDPGFFSHMARGLNLRGVPVAVIGYDLCPEVTIADIIGEVRFACAELRRRFGLPLVAYGHSAGAPRRLPARDQLAAGGPRHARWPGARGLWRVRSLQPQAAHRDEREREAGPHFRGIGAAEPVLLARALAPRPRRGGGRRESAEYLKQSRRIVDVWGLEACAPATRRSPAKTISR